MPLTTFGATAMTVGLLSALTCTGSAVAMSNHALTEDKYDRSITVGMSSLVKEIKAQSVGAGNTKEVKDIIATLPAELTETTGTSVYASGTVEAGYCLVAIDTRGELAETGIFYDSRNPDAKTLAETTSCKSDFIQAAPVIGEGADGNETKPDATDKALTMTFGALGVSLTGLLSCLLPVSLRHGEDDDEEIPSLSVPAKVEPPKPKPVVVVTPPKAEPVASSPSKSSPEFTKEGIQHKLAHDVSLRSGPGSYYPQIMIAKKNSILTTTGHANSGWYEVLTAGKTVWVNSEFLAGAFPSSPVPAVKEDSNPASVVVRKPVTPQEAIPVRTVNVQALLKKYASIKAEWASYELDLIKVLDYPSVTNLSLPATSNFHKALSFTGYLAEDINKDSSVHEAERFEEAVLDLNHKFKVMINEAKRLRWNSYTPQEQTSLRMAQKLLAMATNESSTAHERQIAYKRLIKEIEGIIALPEKAMFALEARISPSLNSSINS